MAFTSTTLSAALSAYGKTLTVASTTGFPAVGVVGSRQRVKIDGEEMMVDVVPVSGTVRVLQRGYNGTAAVAHDALSTVVTSSLGEDWTGLQMGVDTDRPPFVDDVISVGQNGTISSPTRNTTIMLTKGSALATTTLANPPRDRDGLRVTVTSATDWAHVITGVFADGTTGSHTTATFLAFNGASMILVAQQGTWNTVSLEGVSIT